MNSADVVSSPAAPPSVLKHEQLRVLYDTRVLLILRSVSAQEAHRVARAAISGGIRAVEITLSVPGALDVIARLREEIGDDCVIGAGTILDAHAAWSAIQAGAQLLVSPQVNPDMLRLANRYQVPTVCGAFTPTEIVTALEHGADLIKLFPAETAGPEYLRAVKAPLPQAPMIPTGGVDADSAAAWLAAGASVLGVGSSVARAGGGSSVAVTDAAARLMAAVRPADFTQ